MSEKTIFSEDQNLIQTQVYEGGLTVVNTGSGGVGGSAGGVTLNPPVNIGGTSQSDVQVAIESLAASNPFIFPFSFGDASPAPIITVLANQVVRKITIVILVSFNGTNSQIFIGDAGDADRLFPASAIDLTEVASWEWNPDYRYTASTPINLTIVPDGATQGNGFLYIQRG